MGTLLAVIVAVTGAASVLAQTATPPAMACGRVVAYTAPTATTQGSITLGTTTFALKAGSLPDNPNAGGGGIAVGGIVCLDENQAGEILARPILVDTMTQCGLLTAISPSTATSKGSITLQGNRTRIVQVRANTSLTGAQIGTSACFKFDFDAAGDPEIVAFVSSQPAAAPRQLPSTSTESPLPAAALGLLVVGAIALMTRLLLRSATRTT